MLIDVIVSVVIARQLLDSDHQVVGVHASTEWFSDAVESVRHDALELVRGNVKRHPWSMTPYCRVTPWVREKQQPRRLQPRRDTSARLLAQSEFHRGRGRLRWPQAGLRWRVARRHGPARAPAAHATLEPWRGAVPLRLSGPTR